MEFIDLFAGCGGLSLGLEWAGLRPVGAVELDGWAVQTYRANHPETEISETDIREFDDRQLRRRWSGVDGVVGGPPCQGFSVSGKRQYGIHLPSNRLVLEFIRVVSVLKPRFFLLENVRGFTSARFGTRTKVMEVVLSKLRREGYHLYHQVLDANDFGVPQTRRRFFVVGSKYPVDDPFPAPIHGSDKLDPVSVWSAIGDLPKIQAREGTDDFQSYDRDAHSEYALRMRGNATGVYNHEAMMIE